MTRTYKLDEFELRAIVFAVISCDENAAPSYALLLADFIEGKNMTPDEIVSLFEDDQGELFPYNKTDFDVALVKAGH